MTVELTEAVPRAFIMTVIADSLLDVGIHWWRYI